LFCRFRISGFNRRHQIWFFLPAAGASGFWFPRKDSRHRVLGSDRVTVCLVSFSMQEPCPGVQRAWVLRLPAGPAVTRSKSRPSEAVFRFMPRSSVQPSSVFGFVFSDAGTRLHDRDFVSAPIPDPPVSSFCSAGQAPLGEFFHLQVPVFIFALRFLPLPGIPWSGNRSLLGFWLPRSARAQGFDQGASYAPRSVGRCFIVFVSCSSMLIARFSVCSIHRRLCLPGLVRLSSSKPVLLLNHRIKGSNFSHFFYFTHDFLVLHSSCLMKYIEVSESVLIVQFWSIIVLHVSYLHLVVIPL
jgi:hypothetical protein